MKQARRRLEAARRGQQVHRARIDDIYRYMMPWRLRHGQSQPSLADGDELFDGTGIEVLEDFAADMGNTFTPMKAQWVDIEPAAQFGRADAAALAAPLRAWRQVVFDAIEQSNFAEAVQEAYLDLFVGTIAILIEDPDPAGPIHCEAVPVTDLLIDRDPRGGVGPRFRELRLRAEDIPVLWPEARLPESLAARIRSVPDADVTVTQGLWRDWPAERDSGRETWRLVIWIGGDILLSRRWEGAGACPLIVARWRPDGATAYGIGPGHRALPDVKTKNKLRELVLRNADLATDPPFLYDDDGVLNFSAGILPGYGYARMPGSKLDTIDPRRSFDVSFLLDDDLRRAILRAGFQDKPLQRGRTPPSATQFLEERVDKAKRMGSPAGRLITEWQLPIFQRFAWLLERRGALPPVALNGRQVALKPVSPLTRAQQQEEALQLERYVEGVIQAFPQAAAAILNPFEYARRRARHMGIEDDGLIAREQDLAALIGQASGNLLAGGGDVVGTASGTASGTAGGMGGGMGGGTGGGDGP